MSPTANVFRHNETLCWEHLRDLSPELSFTNGETKAQRGRDFAKATQQSSGRFRVTSKARAQSPALTDALPSPRLFPILTFLSSLCRDRAWPEQSDLDLPLIVWPRASPPIFSEPLLPLLYMKNDNAFSLQNWGKNRWVHVGKCPE